MSAESSDQRPPTEPVAEPVAEPQGEENRNGADQQAVELAELRDRWQRALAELDNLRKRQVRELRQALSAERSAVAGAWLPVLDNLERALEHADADPDAIVTGVRAVRDQAVELLARLGYPRQDEAVGVPFDPVRHEVVTVVDEPSATPGTVVEVLRPGYGEADRQLRPQAVAVSRRAE